MSATAVPTTALSMINEWYNTADDFSAGRRCCGRWLAHLSVQRGVMGAERDRHEIAGRDNPQNTKQNTQTHKHAPHPTTEDGAVLQGAGRPGEGGATKSNR